MIGSTTNVPTSMKVWLDGAAAASQIVRAGGTMEGKSRSPARNSRDLLRQRLLQRQKVAPREPLLQRAAQQEGGVISRERADLAASGVVFEPAPSRLGNSLPGREQRLRCRLPETDKDVGVGKLDQPADERQADGGFLRRRRAVSRRPPRHHVGDIRFRAVEPDRRQHEVEEFSGAADERQAGYVFVAPRRFADEHDARLRIAVGKNELRRGGGGGAAA